MVPLSTQSLFQPSRLCRGVCLLLVRPEILTGSRRTFPSLPSRTSLLSMDHLIYPLSALDMENLSFRASWIPTRCTRFPLSLHSNLIHHGSSLARTPSPEHRQVSESHIAHCDAHTVTTSGQQYELLDWLQQITFPMEARFVDVDFARRAYRHIVKRVINSGVPQSFFLQFSGF